MNNKEKMPYKKNEKGLCLTPYWYLLKLMSWLWNVSNSIYVGLALMVNTLPANEEEVKDTGSIPASGRSPGEGNDNPLQYSCLENPMDRGSLAIHSSWNRRVGHDGSDWTCMRARLLMLTCVKVNKLLFYILVVTQKAWNHKIFQKFQNLFSWNVHFLLA